MSDTVTPGKKDGTQGVADHADVGMLWIRGGNEHFEVQGDMKARSPP
jgi:hypothetical protein